MAAIDDSTRSINSVSDDLRHVAQGSAPSHGIEAFKDILYGSTAGVLGKFIEYPFDTVKVRLQAQQHSSHDRSLNGPLDAFKAALRSPEGPFRSLYRGISAPLLGAAIETSSLFFSYRVAQEMLLALKPSLSSSRDVTGKVVLPLSTLVACGAASGAFTSLLLTPIELIKCKMQVPLNSFLSANGADFVANKAPGPIALIRSIFKSHGILGFWHGQLGTLIRETGGSAAWFGSYEGIKLLFIKHDPNITRADQVKVWQQMSAGAVAGMAYNFVFYPADTIKSRMQTEEANAPASKKFLETGRKLWRQQGLRGFYRGCGITVLRAAPSSAIIFSIYEALRLNFG